MDLHLVTAPGAQPLFVTVETESKRIAREIGGAARPITVPDTKKEFVPFMNLLFEETHGPSAARRIEQRIENTRPVEEPATAEEVYSSAPPRGYSSPFSADTTIQRIDASMCAAAIKTMTNGKALADILGALVDRLAEIRGE